MAIFNIARAVPPAQPWLKALIYGVTGSGKSLTSLMMAKYIADRVEGRVCVIDTELTDNSDPRQGKISEYASHPLVPQFDVMRLPDHMPQTVEKAFLYLVNEIQCYKVVIIDGISPMWEQANFFAETNGGYPLGRLAANKMMDAMMRAFITSPIHGIFTSRCKMEYARRETIGKGGSTRTIVEAAGLVPVFRDQNLYDFKSIFHMRADHTCEVVSTKYQPLDGGSFPSPGGVNPELFAHIGASLGLPEEALG